MSSIATRITQSITGTAPEADVFIVCVSEDNTRLRVVPFWECAMTPADLISAAVAEAATFVEQIGAGTVESLVIDLRATQ